MSLACITIDRSEANQLYSHLYPTTSYNGFGDVDMVIEAVFEDIDIKHRVIEEVEKVWRVLSCHRCTSPCVMNQYSKHMYLHDLFLS